MGEINSGNNETIPEHSGSDAVPSTSSEMPQTTDSSTEDSFFDVPEETSTSFLNSLWREEAADQMCTLERKFRQLSFLTNRTHSQEKLVQDFQEHWNSSNYYYILSKYGRMPKSQLMQVKIFALS